MATLPTLTLTYLDLTGRAEAIRLALRMADVPFLDERLSPAQANDRKAELPYGKLPVLTVDGEMLAETQPIFRYVGRLTGMYPPPAEPIACAMVDEILDSFDDLFARAMQPLLSASDQAVRDETIKTTLPQALARLDKRMLVTKRSPFFVERPTTVFIHEVLASTYVDYIMAELSGHVPEWYMDDYLTMQAAHVKVGAHQTVRQPTQPRAMNQPLPKPQHVTLSYFDMPGRAEAIRLALHVGGISFKDERLSYDEYQERKATLPNGNLPVLSVDGHVLAQSAAILRYAGAVTGLYPAADPVQALKVDEVLSHISELFYAIDPWFAATGAQKRELGETLAAHAIKDSLTALDKRVATWQAATPSEKMPFALGATTMTIADIAVHTLLTFLQTEFVGENKTSSKITGAFAQLTQISEAVAKHPSVAEWSSKRLPPMA